MRIEDQCKARITLKLRRIRNTHKSIDKYSILSWHKRIKIKISSKYIHGEHVVYITNVMDDTTYLRYKMGLFRTVYIT